MCLGALDKQAEYIIMNEVRIFTSLVSMSGMTASGVKRFVWITMQDANVRDSHAHLHGKIFSFKRPPLIDGRRLLPAEDYNCRCKAGLVPTDRKKLYEGLALSA